MLCAFTFARPREAPGPPLRDFQAYYSAGQTWAAGRDPYGPAIWQVERTLPGADTQRQELLPFIGPPATLLLWAAFARLPYPIAANLWRAVLCLSLVALVWSALVVCGMLRSLVAWLALALAILAFGPVTSAFALGQLALPAAALVALTVAVAPPAIRWLTSALAFAQPNVAIALVEELRGLRRPIPVLIGVFLFVAASIAVAGLGSWAAYAHAAAAHGSAEQFAAIQITPAAVAYGFGASAVSASAIGKMSAIAAIIAWCICAYQVDDRIALFCIGAALLPFAMPFFHEHDLAVVFVPAVVLVMRAPQRILPVALCGALLCAVNWIEIAEHPDAVWQSALLLAVFGAVLLALRPRIAGRDVMVTCGIIILIGAAAFAVGRQPMPLWPDALPAHFSARAANIAAMWHGELVVAGLFTQDAMWALLRCGSLLGVALLVCAAAFGSPLFETHGAGLDGEAGRLKTEFSQ